MAPERDTEDPDDDGQRLLAAPVPPDAGGGPEQHLLAPESGLCHEHDGTGMRRHTPATVERGIGSARRRHHDAARPHGQPHAGTAGGGRCRRCLSGQCLLPELAPKRRADKSQLPAGTAKRLQGRLRGAGLLTAGNRRLHEPVVQPEDQRIHSQGVRVP